MDTRDRRAWYVISLRPRGEHDAVRKAAARAGAKLLALSPWRLQARDDDAARTALQHALRCSRVVFTSPAAVKFAQSLQPLQAQRNQHWLAVGAGTANALRRAGIEHPQHPRRMDSEGLLALPALRDFAGDVGLVTAPGGRGLIADALAQRGARIVRADVYARAPAKIPAAALHALRTLDAPAVVLVSSAEALHATLAQLDGQHRAHLLRHPAAAAGTRLRDVAAQAGFERIAVAEGPRPAQLVRAAAHAAHIEWRHNH